MKCAKCNSVVSIADSKCPKCGHNLLQFGATVFYEPKEKDSSRYGHSVKDITFGGLRGETNEVIDSLSAEEMRILMPVEKRLNSLFLRHLSEEALERLYDNEIIPIIDELSRDKNAQLIFKKIESNIRQHLGEATFQYYHNKLPKIINMLRTGELACLLIKKGDIDFSIKMFEFFKSSEVACHEHAEERLNRLTNREEVVNVDRVIGEGPDDVRKENVIGRDIPEWFDGNSGENVKGHKKAFVILLDMLLERKNKNNLINTRNTGLALYIFGRNSLEIKGKNIAINNIFDAKGSMILREKLARDLCELQSIRNDMVHKSIMVLSGKISKWKSTAYNCLKAIPTTLEI